MAADKFHLGWFINGYRVHGWRDQWIGTHKSEGMMPQFYIDMARSLERACFDYFIIEDSSFVPDAWEGKHNFYIENAYAVPKFDPSVLASILTQNTSRLGIVATLAITEYPPYLLARLVSTLDHVSKGRAGWNMVTASSDRAAQNYGHTAQPAHDIRYDMAEEFTELVVKLWESWEPESMIVNQDGVFADPDKVHPVNHEGTYYKSRGPINTARSPQGRSVIVQAGGSAKGRAYASKYADSIMRRRHGELHQMSMATAFHLADVLTAQNLTADAVLVHQRSVAACERLGDVRGVITSRRDLASALHRDGRCDDGLREIIRAVWQWRATAGHSPASGVRLLVAYTAILAGCGRTPDAIAVWSANADMLPQAGSARELATVVGLLNIPQAEVEHPPVCSRRPPEQRPRVVGTATDHSPFWIPVLCGHIPEGP